MMSTIMAVVNLGRCACCRHCLELNFGQKYATTGSIGNHVHLHSRVFVLQTSAPSVGLQILHFDLRAMQLLRSLDRNFLDHFNLKTSPVSLIDFGFKIIHAWIGTWKFSCWLKWLMQKNDANSDCLHFCWKMELMSSRDCSKVIGTCTANHKLRQTQKVLRTTSLTSNYSAFSNQK